jgi:hypothetical protein
MNDQYNKTMKFDSTNVQKIRDEVDLAYSEKVNDVTKTMGRYEIATKAVEAKLNQLVGESGALELFGKYIGTINDVLLRAAESLRGFIENPRSFLGPAIQEDRRIAEQERAARSIPQLDPLTGQPMPAAPTVGSNGNPDTQPELRPLSDPNVDHYARGGITDYPASGRLAMLHGREAVIPLPSGLRAEDLGDMFKTMQEKLDPQDRARLQESLMKTNLTEMERSVLDSKMAQLSSDSMMERLTAEMVKMNEGMERMISEARNISAYTERTARGVA